MRDHCDCAKGGVKDGSGIQCTEETSDCLSVENLNQGMTEWQLTA